MNIVDRRLNPKGKSLANRQRFLRRARGADPARRCVDSARPAQASSDTDERREDLDPEPGHRRAAFHRAGQGGDARLRAARQQGVHRRRPHRAAAAGRRRRRRRRQAAEDGEGEDAFEFALTRGGVPRPLLRGPGAARPRQAPSSRRPRRPSSRAPAISIAGSPTNLNAGAHHAQQPGAAHRAAPAASATRSPRSSSRSTTARAPPTTRRRAEQRRLDLEMLQRRRAPRGFPSSTRRRALQPLRAHARARPPRR